MATIIKDDYTGYRWLNTVKGDVFEDKEPVDAFGDEGAQSELHYDLAGFFEIKFDKTVVAHINHFLQFKFDADIKRHDVYLFWQKRPSFGVVVDNILEDAERFWSLAKAHYIKSIGRTSSRRV
jgi:hypothetical protein